MTGSDGGFTRISPKPLTCPFCGSDKVRSAPSPSADGKTPRLCLSCKKRWAQ